MNNYIKSIKSNSENIEQLLEQIIVNAINLQASDVHFEPFAQESRLRMRIDGILHTQQTFSSDVALRLSSRLKILANLDIAEKRLPQDGRFTFALKDNPASSILHSVNDSKFIAKSHENLSSFVLHAEVENHDSHYAKSKIDDRKYDCRVSTCPTMFGEKIVVRLLNRKQNAYDLKLLGLNNEQIQTISSYLYAPQGMILVTGPTGSGKTVTLYTMLNMLNNTERNILTIEDPIEIDLHGINQVEVNYKIGLDFATALRTFLRQDPDVIMIGEIRDLETAQMAIKASQTGHLVLATLHTNSASASILRLLNMHVENYNLAESLRLIIAQRLIRNLCSNCKVAYKIDKNVFPQDLLKQKIHQKMLINDTEVLIYKPHLNGCSFCTNGYSGRSGIFESMPISENIANMILHNRQQLELEQQAQSEGMHTLRYLAWEKVLLGITSIEEINRVVL